jgi:hypothetical protein
MVSYQFYYLFFKSLWVTGENIIEPDRMANLNPEQSNLKCKLYEDKRLFRFELNCDNTLESAELNKQLYDYHQQLTQYYDSKQQSEALLYAVSVVIIDPELTSQDKYIIDPELTSQDKYIVKIPIQQDETYAWTQFEADGENLSVRATNNNDKSQIIYLADFKLNTQELPAKFRHTEQWQIKFEQKQAVLAPLKSKESEHHPILHFYGLIWKNPNSQPKPDILDKMILDGLLLDTMPYLLMARWQFAHIYLSADAIIQELDKKTGEYRHIEDKQLSDSTLEQLRAELQKINHLEATTQYELSRTTQAIQTIENNINNITFDLQKHYTLLDKKGWSLNWQWRVDSLKYLRQEQAQTIPALLEQASFASRELTNKTVYIEGLLKHLQGSKLRWLNLVAQKEHQTQKRLNVLVNGLLILGAVISIFELLKDNGFTLSPVSQILTIIILIAVIYSYKLFKE